MVVILQQTYLTNITVGIKTRFCLFRSILNSWRYESYFFGYHVIAKRHEGEAIEIV